MKKKKVLSKVVPFAHLIIYAQVAEELNISTKTVDAQLQKALTRLKEAGI